MSACRKRFTILTGTWAGASPSTARHENKGFEVIEAHHLFDLPYEQIDVVIHRESIIHSMVEYQDHAIIAQMGTADMRLPIQYALSYPHRLKMENAQPLDLLSCAQLHFEAASFARWPLLAAAYDTGKEAAILARS